MRITDDQIDAICRLAHELAGDRAQVECSDPGWTIPPVVVIWI